MNAQNFIDLTESPQPTSAGRKTASCPRPWAFNEARVIEEDDSVGIAQVDLTHDREELLDELTQPIPYVDLLDDEPDLEFIGERPATLVKLQGATLALNESVEFPDGKIIRIEKVIKTSTGRTFITGKQLVYPSAFGVRYPLRENEIIWLEGNFSREIKPNWILRNRQVIFTNFSWKENSNDASRRRNDNAQQGHDLATLYCRMKRKALFREDSKQMIEESWSCLDMYEADSGYRIAPALKRTQSRRCRTIRKGGHKRRYEVIDEDGLSGNFTSEQKYSFGDAFCGAGGASCGARQADLEIKWSFDIDKKPLTTYRRNFSQAEILPVSVYDFIGTAKQDPRYVVDILHMSPPCQPFSPARTTGTEAKNEINQAPILSVMDILEAVTPRIVTVEETAGLVNRHKQWFGYLINMFISKNYQVRWRVATCGDYGVPQLTRKRLLLIAAGPGEVLPKFPRPTHSLRTEAGTTKVPTIGDTIAGLQGIPDHEIPNPYQHPKPPFTAQSYAKTITCRGGDNCHPSGLRPYSVREFACLQTFPRNFKFGDVSNTDKKKQIGNAVPPALAKALFESIKKSLLATDSEEGDW